MRASFALVTSLGTFTLLGTAVSFAACAAGNDPAASPGFDAGADGSNDVELTIDTNTDVARDTKPVVVDPKTCEEAAESKSYVGCDFYPTVVANSVWDIFDFAAIVANAGTEEARITVTGPAGFKKEAIVGPGRLVKVYLPWVKELKGAEADSCGRGTALTGTIRANKAAYHIVTSKPVTVYQFNALEYEGVGGPPDKTWTSCPGDLDCVSDEGFIGPIGCYSFTNDASLLLPSTALSGTYRITGVKGASGVNTYVAITGTKDATEVTVSLGTRGRILAGGGLSYTSGGGTATFTLNESDVIELLVSAGPQFDLSGSLIRATKPVQVIAGAPCITQPTGAPACDHVEEIVFPAETMGREYVVTMPTGPDGAKPGHVVRLYGNVDGTELKYVPAPPTPTAPVKINAGEVIDLGVVKEDFVIAGTAEFAVGSFMLGGSLVDPTAFEGLQKGDPSMSMITSVEQFRTKYVFLAPDDYLVNYVDIVAPKGTIVKLDDAELGSPETLSGYDVHRVKLGPGPQGVGAHSLTSNKPVGIQVFGYGLYTSYHYPGGLNLSAIAPPPVK